MKNILDSMEAILKTHDFYYDLPEELIAQDPLEDRSGSRLMVLDKKTGRIEHRIFRQITQYLHQGDCLVINNTKVIPARLIGEKLHEAVKAVISGSVAVNEEEKEPHGAKIE
jgi:S-adenosylmethionine:tRNA ribosyltransferase-isomerase